MDKDRITDDDIDDNDDRHNDDNAGECCFDDNVDERDYVTTMMKSNSTMKVTMMTIPPTMRTTPSKCYIVSKRSYLKGRI